MPAEGPGSCGPARIKVLLIYSLASNALHVLRRTFWLINEEMSELEWSEAGCLFLRSAMSAFLIDQFRQFLDSSLHDNFVAEEKYQVCSPIRSSDILHTNANQL
jgi:hypothetical protein